MRYKIQIPDPIMERIMRRAVFLLLVAASVVRGPSAVAQGTPPAANPKDVASADAIIAAVYEANSIMVDQKKDPDRFRSLFVPDARMMPTATAPNRVVILRTQTVEEYIKAAMSGPQRGGFFEREISRTMESYGPIMQAFSTYESRRNVADTTRVRGINSIQLYNDGTRWWVVGVLWANERNNGTIPPAYLKSSGKPH
jgi:hypothetical protein